jgi:uncharacterized protein YkwD
MTVTGPARLTSMWVPGPRAARAPADTCWAGHRGRGRRDKIGAMRGPRTAGVPRARCTAGVRGSAAGPRAAAAVALVALLAPVLAPPRAAAAHEVVPDARGARNYFAPMPAGAGIEVMTDGLQRALFEVVVRAARARGQRAPEADARLEAVAAALARTLGPDEVPGIDLQEFLLSHHGLADPVPELAMLQVALDDGFIRERMGRSLGRILGGGPFGRVGIGVHRRFLGPTTVVVALQRVDLEMLPVPRRLEVGASAMLGGRLLRGLSRPAVLVALPGAEVRSLPVRANGDSFQTSLRCDAGAGRYQVEIVGVGAAGKTVVANFPVYCGVAPPVSAPRVAVGGPESSDPRKAEALLLAAVNRDRAAVGLAPVAWDEPLARAARAYSQEMSERQQVDHVSARSGNAADRVRRAGVDAVFVFENVARANSVAEAQRSFMTSPGHRANVLARNVTRLGAGVVIRNEAGGVPSLYVTQLFAR